MSQLEADELAKKMKKNVARQRLMGSSFFEPTTEFAASQEEAMALQPKAPTPLKGPSSFPDQLPEMQEGPPSGVVQYPTAAGPEAPEVPPEEATYKGPLAPRYYDAAIKGLEGRIKELPQADRSTYLEELKKAREIFQESKGSLQKGELAEKLVHAITQLAAGWYGLKHGQDLSGVKFEPSDWKQKYQESLDDYRMSLSEAGEKEGYREKLTREQERLTEKKGGLELAREEAKYRTSDEARREQNAALRADWMGRARDAARQDRELALLAKEDRKAAGMLRTERAQAADARAKLFTALATKEGITEEALGNAVRAHIPDRALADKEIDSITSGWFFAPSDEGALRQYVAGLAATYRAEADRLRAGTAPSGGTAPATQEQAGNLSPEEESAVAKFMTIPKEQRTAAQFVGLPHPVRVRILELEKASK